MMQKTDYHRLAQPGQRPPERRCEREVEVNFMDCSRERRLGGGNSLKLIVSPTTKRYGSLVDA